jgi:predicted ATPase/class 3 adenylate cyclase
VAPELPTGTVTFLFTDIEGSTRLLDELGDGYAELLAEHHRLMRGAFVPHGGVEVDTQGDAFFVAFQRASDAVAAAADAQAALEPTGLRVRMGIHTGEPLLTETGYVGMDVHRAARVMSAGHGGQVLISQTSRDLLDERFEPRDLGEHRLKDLSAPQRLHQLGGEEFPPLKTLYRTSLPIQPTPLVGRERELQEAGALLRANRLVTLVGPGGSGKTRLGLQVGADATEDFVHGVFWIPLQAVSDPALVPATVAQGVGAPGDPVEFLGGKSALLLLDNLEQLVEAAPFVAKLLTETTGVKVLATSRESLRVAGEQRYPVDPLPERDAVTLFLERARAIDPAFEPTPAVADICRRLDGLPLALELAAARVSLLGADALLERLQRALPVLTGGARDAPERQQTLRATIEWSYELLDDEERRVFASLAVFAGSFELDAALAVCEADLDTLHSLVEKSLVRRWGSGRYGLLETIHEYSRERLAEGAVAVGRRHAEHYLDVAKAGNYDAESTADADPQIARLEASNFRAALKWAVDAREFELGLRLAIALEHVWVASDPFEGARWFEALLSDGAAVDPAVRAAALRSFGGVVYIVGEFERGAQLYEESLALYRSLGDEWGETHLVHRLASEAGRVGDTDRARTLAEQGLAASRRLGDQRGVAIALSTLAGIAEKSGDREKAMALFRDSARVAQEAGFIWFAGGSLLTLAELAEMSGRIEDAAGWLREGLGLVARLDDRQHLVYGLALAARVLAQQRRVVDAGVLWGAVEAEEQRGRVGQWESDRAEYADPLLAYASPEFEEGRAEGHHLSLDEGVQRFLAEA